MNPYRVTGPAVIQCSFGRTSGKMLWEILDAYDGKLPPDVHVLFENTGKERPETLEFGMQIPLAEAGVTNEDVLDFWSKQKFDLNLPIDENGATVGGNCDLCFMKAMPKKLRLIREDERNVTWWEEQEDRTGMTFRPNGATYRKLHLRALQPEACNVDDELGDCFCGD